MQMAKKCSGRSERVQNNLSDLLCLPRAGFAGIQALCHAANGQVNNTASDGHMMAGYQLVNSLDLSGGSPLLVIDVGGLCRRA